MKFIVVFVALIAFAMALPRPDAPEILSLESDVGPNSFKYAFETSDDVKVDAEGELHNVGSENEALQVRGSYSFVGDDGVTYVVKYVADENGFQPEGAHLPVAPEA